MMTTTSTTTVMMLFAAALCFLITTASALPVEHKVRMDFYQAMTKATKHSQQDLQQRLLRLARPRVLEQGDDAAANGDDAVANGDDQYVNNDGLDLREYAFKYVACQTISSWSDNLAQDEDATTVLAKNSFAVFRMCPSDSCSTYNSLGCMYDYGEYMILLQDYLAIMSEYHYTRYGEYCATCSDCMNGGNDNNNDDGGGNNNNARRRLADDDGGAADDDAYNYNADAYDDGYIYPNNDDGAGDDAAAAAYQCQYETACQNYQEACSSYNANDVAFDEYFACVESADVNGNVIYLGPHCKSDGHSITIGVFNDEYCSEYVGDVVDMQSTTGIAMEENSLDFYYSESCVSCDATETYDLYQNDEDGIYDLCNALYDASAKCNRALYESDRYESDNQEETEDAVCGFIESLIMNTYDENGEINLAKMYFDPNNWKSFSEYTKVVAPGQIFGLVFSILLCMGLAIYAVYLYGKIRKARQWRSVYHVSPRRDPNAHLAGKISRVHSGIMYTRSSEGTYA